MRTTNQIKKIDLYNNSKFKIFNFLKYGKVVASVEADTQEEAVEYLKTNNYKIKDFDQEIVYDKKTSIYTYSNYGYKRR